MLELHKCSPRMPQEQEMVKREIEPAADRQIDSLVYELYGLSEDEVKVVEGRNGKSRTARDRPPPSRLRQDTSPQGGRLKSAARVINDERDES
jgi:hypothetical protein